MILGNWQSSGSQKRMFKLGLGHINDFLKGCNAAVQTMQQMHAPMQPADEDDEHYTGPDHQVRSYGCCPCSSLGLDAIVDMRLS